MVICIGFRRQRQISCSMENSLNDRSLEPNESWGFQGIRVVVRGSMGIKFYLVEDSLGEKGGN